MVQIAEMCNIAYSHVVAMKKRERWADAPIVKRIESSLEARYVMIVAKPDKTPQDISEIKALGTELERVARIEKYTASGNGAVFNPKLSQRRGGKKSDPAKRNRFDDEQITALKTAFFKRMWPYQRHWWDVRGERIRNIFKTRQCGGTEYFAREALYKAVSGGENTIFISASKNQAHIFKEYIRDFALEVGVELSGDPIKLSNDATLYFLGTNAKTSQSYHGNLVMDEYHWIPDFKKVHLTSSGIATHKAWTQTYLSTASVVGHPGFAFWSGEHFNAGRKKSDKVEIDISHRELKKGVRCADGQWRQILTIEDAIAGGNDLYSIEDLRNENAPDEFANKYMCVPINDANSIFTLAEIQKCMIDSLVEWEDFNPLHARPLGNEPVWIGYDPSLNRDPAALAVLAPPREPGGKFRLIEKLRWSGMDFATQAAKIQSLTHKYNVEYIGIDRTGIGHGVFELVSQFYPRVTPITYSVDIKNRLVLKAKNIFAAERFECDANDAGVAAAFLTIQKGMTASGRRESYQSARTETEGHGDIAWAIMNALDNEPFTMGNGHAAKTKKSFMGIYPC